MKKLSLLIHVVIATLLWPLAASAYNGQITWPQGSTTSGQGGILVQCAVTTAAPSYTTAQTSPCSVDTSGSIRVTATNANANVGNNADAVATSATAGSPVVDYLYGFNGTTWDRLQVDGNKYLKIDCVTGCSSSGGSSLADEGTFTQGTTSFTVAGGIYNTSITNLTSGQAGAVAMTNTRHMKMDLEDQAGTTLGTPTNYGTAPSSASPALSANAYVTNANPNGPTTAANSSPVVLPADVTPSTINITAADAATTSATWANSQTVYTGTPTANSAASFTSSSVAGGALQVSGTWQGTLQFEGSTDGGTHWASTGVHQRGTGYWFSSTTSASSGVTGDFIAEFNVAGFTNFRVRATSWTSGTATVAPIETGNPTLLYSAANISSIGGSPTVTGTGASGAGIPRVTISNDSSLAANQSVNVAQVNGATTSTAASGVQKVGVVGNAGAAFDAATGAAPPANVLYMGANASGATGGHVVGLIVCDNHVFKHITTATDTLAVQGVASQTIYVCGATGGAAGTATYYLENTASANANCASTLTQIAGVKTVAANNDVGFYNPTWGGLKNTSGNGLCINSTGTGGVDVDIWYTQF